MPHIFFLDIDLGNLPEISYLTHIATLLFLNNFIKIIPILWM